MQGGSNRALTSDREMLFIIIGKRFADDPASCERIIDVIVKAGGKAVLTGDANCGSDRVAMAAEIVNPDGLHSLVINQQGDMPFISPEHLRIFAREAKISIHDMATAVCDLGMVEVRESNFFRVASRLHIGLYAFTRKALRHFHALPQSPRELDVKLEQLRAVGQLDIKFVPLSHIPQEVNTPADYEAANALINAAKASLSRA